MFQLFKRNFKAKTTVIGESRASQLDLNLPRRPEPDRNFSKGGRSFYFFDFDDNIAVLGTPTVVFNKANGRELILSSKEFAEHSGQIGRVGMYRDYEIRLEDAQGSFR
ncbi:MAG: hypothetical protein AABZ31_06845, partial [Bdellovibrionota bacterium]